MEFDDKNVQHSIKKHKSRNYKNNIFQFLITVVKEFPTLITGYDDFVSNLNTTQMNPDSEDKKLDGLFERRNGKCVNIEHESEIRQRTLIKDGSYVLNNLASADDLEQFVVYTGDDEFPLYLSSPNLYYHMNVIRTRDIWGPTHLNAIKYKVSHNEELNGFDILDLCLMPFYGNVQSETEVVEEVVSIAPEIKANDFLLKVFARVMVTWICNIFKDYDTIGELIGVIEMNKRIDMDDMLEYATTALYTRIVEQKDSIIKNQRIALQQKDATIQQKDATIKQQNVALQQKDAEIDKLKKELEIISEINT